jgi:hypothetical protein
MASATSSRITEVCRVLAHFDGPARFVDVLVAVPAAAADVVDALDGAVRAGLVERTLDADGLCFCLTPRGADAVSGR